MKIKYKNNFITFYQTINYFLLKLNGKFRFLRKLKIFLYHEEYNRKINNLYDFLDLLVGVFSH